MKKIFLLLIKYIPIMQMVGMLIANSLYCFDIVSKFQYIIDFIFGNTIITTFLLYICSYVFKFCKWHRFIITANLTNICIVEYDILFGIPINDYQLLLSYYIVAAIFTLLAIYSKFNCNESKLNEITCETFKRCC